MIIEQEAILDRKNIKVAKIFWFGFILYTIGFTASITGIISFKLCQGIQTIGIILMGVSLSKLIKYEIKNSYVKILFSVYCIWLIFIIVRGFSFEWEFLKRMLFDAWFGVFLYFVPLFLLLPKNIYFLSSIFSTIIILGIVSLVFDYATIRQLLNPDINDLESQSAIEYISKTLAIPCGFILLTYPYHKLKSNLGALLIFLVTLFFSIVRARRGLIFMLFLPLAFTFLIYILSNSKKASKWISSLLMMVALVLFSLYFFSQNKTGLFNAIVERIEQDTRTGVELDFYADTDLREWLIGKGVNGSYFSPGIDSPWSVYRTTIETDYLQVILKGGLISLVLLLLIAVPAMLKGFFSSQNTLSKAAAFWILFWMLSLYPATVTTFTLTYILVWISIGICYSEEIRNLPEKDMIKYFKFHKAS